MTASEIITQFELQVGDTTELSSAEELMLLNRVYKRVCSDRPWEFLKTQFSGTTSTTVPYIALPATFGYAIPNYDYSTDNYYAGGPFALVGTTSDPYQIIPYSDRNRYVNANNKAYIDEVNNRIVFTLQPTAANTVVFDYIAAPADLTLSDTPLIPTRFQPILVYGMASEDMVLQLFDRSSTYKPENDQQYTKYLSDMARWNARAGGFM